VKLISKGDFAGAVRLIREKIPFPASIGRICPHPCETACRRALVEEPISICSLKQFSADFTGHDFSNTPLPQQSTAKKVAVIGGGPGGLSAAYYLRLKGHAVTGYEAMPALGGMLRYGVPEFRLPKKVLQNEIDIIGNCGVKYITGRRVTLEEIQKSEKYDVIITAIGAWNSTKLNNIEAIGGIDYLLQSPDISGKIVAVVGGGNTAMDACRVAARSKAAKVYCVYRRRREDMPADPHEVAGAENDGVVFLFTTQPDKIPDCIPEKRVDLIISAIGQKPDLTGFEQLAKTDWGTITADEFTFQTNIENVFAIGDAVNDGADIAIRAIGEGRKCAQAVDDYLNNKPFVKTSPYLAKSKKTQADFADKEKHPRTIDLTSEQSAVKEASRCLECGCSAFPADYNDKNCKLYLYANQYGVQPDKFGDIENNEIEKSHNKCILCGLCVRVCEQIEKKTALGLHGRGFTTKVQPALGKPLNETTCNNCGKCTQVCPTGELAVDS
jgi:formate dehydrogenase major subunit